MSKTRMGKRVASLLLSLVMMLSLLPTTVYATGGTDETKGAIVEEANTSDDSTVGGTTSDPEATSEDETTAVATISEGGGAATVSEGETATVATIYGTEYKSLDAAIEAVKDGETIMVNGGEYTLPSSQTLYAGKAFDITANGDVTFNMSNAVTMGSAKVTFENVTFNYETNGNYIGLQHADTLVYNNCTIKGTAFLYAVNEKFDCCKFEQTSADAYNVWTYGAQNVTFYCCSFDCAGRAVLVYNEGAAHKTDLTVYDCIFSASAPVAGKAAIEIDTHLMKGATINLSGTMADGFDNGSNSGNSLWNDKMHTAETNTNTTVIVDGVEVYTPIATAAVAQIGETTYETLEEAFDAAKDGDTITLLADCSGNGIQVASGRFNGQGLTVDFNGHTYTVGGVLVGSSGTKSNGFQLNKNNKITFQNGAIYGDASVAGDDTTNWTGAPAILIQNYCDLTLSGMKVSGGSNTVYTLSNNCGNVVIENTTINAGGGGSGRAPFALDACGYTGYTGVSVTVKNSDINGDIEVSRNASNENAVTLTLASGTTVTGALKIDSSIKSGDATTVTKSADVTLAAPDGYLWNAEGVLVAAVAQIGDVKYETLQAAINAANTGDTVTLLTNIDSSVSATYTAQNLTIDLNGYTIKGGTLSTAALKLSVKAVSDANYAVTITSSKAGGAIIGQLPLQLGGSYLANGIKIAIDDSVKLTVLEGGTNAVNQTGSRVYLVGTDTTKAYYKNGGFMVTVNGEDRIYETLGNARSADPNVTLLNDYTTTGALKIWGDWGAFTLDLNGHTYMSTTSQPSMIELQDNAKATFKNGTLKADKAKTVIGSPYDNTTLTLENVTVEAGGDYGIATNGSNTGINITLNDSSIKAPNGVGVYFPSTGSLTINGGSILANTGVQVSAGSLTITGGSITATGTSTEDVSSGSILDGAAVSIIARGGYGALGTLSISGGTFISASGVAAVQAYSIDNGVKGDWTHDGFITGGSFNNIPEDMAKLCAEGYTTVYNKDTGLYDVVPEVTKVTLTRQLTVSNDLSMTYLAKMPKTYTNPYAVFNFYSAVNGWVESTVQGELRTDGRYAFKFTGINPQRMNDTLKITIYATVDGEAQAITAEREDSVVNYCNAYLTKLKDSSDPKYNKWAEIIGNMAEYGAASQKYMNYRTDTLVNGLVTGTTTKDYTDQVASINKFNGVTKVDGGITIKSAKMLLSSFYAMRVYFTLDEGVNLNTVRFTAQVEGNSGEFTEFGTETQNGATRYYFDFRGMTAKQLNSKVTVKSFVNGVENDTLEYSVNMYLAHYIQKPGSDANWNNLVKWLFNYGYACMNY